MREYLFHGKRVNNGEWVEGLLTIDDVMTPTGIERAYCIKEIPSDIGGGFGWVRVEPESVGQYTGMNEFVVADRSFNKPLFEGDIVEVWSTRRPCYSYPKSQHDGDIKVRAVIRFNYGEWTLDYDNNYNKSLAKLKGKEEDERTVDGDIRLYRFAPHINEDWYREHNAHYKWSDIVKIGTVFENKDLLEG